MKTGPANPANAIAPNTKDANPSFASNIMGQLSAHATSNTRTQLKNTADHP
jgi:hypothetical protein